MSEEPLNKKRVYRQTDIKWKFSLPKSTMYAQIAEGLFPEPFPLSARSVGWDAEQVDACMENRMRNPNWLSEASNTH